ncbi:hypothetical protein DL96DRAFT_1631717 [Flagelloscypha sp. PMI_526]|nr:hypothetical protein DL96DRAFT_1631717 [Flagelloscypha sp. PMI_526]
MPRLQNRTSFPLRNPARPSMPQSPTVVTICTHSDATLTILAGPSWDSWALRPAMRTKYNSRALHHLLACELAVLALVKGLGRSHCQIVFTLTESAPGLMNELKFRKSMNKERRASLDRIYHWVKSAGVEAEFVHHKQGRATPIAVPGYRSRRDRIPLSYRIPKVVTELFRRC